MHQDSRFPSRRRFFAGSLAALWLGGLALAGPAAAADMVPQAVFFYKLGTGTSEGPLVVTLNDQGVWADSQQSERTWGLAFRVEWATAVGMVKSFRVFAKPGWGLGSQPDVLGTEAQILHPIQQDVTKALIEQGKIAQFETTAAVTSVFPFSGSSSTPAGVCQLKRNELLANGTLPYDIIANDWIVEKEAKIKAVLDYYKNIELVGTNAGANTVGTNPAQTSAVVTVPLQILCKGDKALADALQPNYQGAYATGFQVTGAELFVAPAYQNLTADCPVTVPLVAEFASTNAGSLKFRFVSASGKVSQLRSVNITQKTGGVFKALYEEHIQVPLTQASGTGGGQSGGGIVDQQSGGGFAVQTQPEEPLFPSAPSSSGMGQVQANPLAGNIHSESFRVEVVEPATGIVSGYAGYRITCTPQAAPGIAAAQNLQMQPRPPQPDGATTVIGGISTPPATPAPRQAQVQAPQVGALTSGVKPDIMGTTLGFLLGGHHAWGSTVVIDKPQLAAATGVGPNKNLCRFTQAGYRAFNKGGVATGPFKNRVYRGSQTVNQSMHSLAPKQTDGWHVFPLELPSGLSVIRVVMDADRQVDESDEDNTFAVRVNVLIDCGGQSRLRVAPGQPQPSPPQRVTPLQPRLPLSN